MTCIARLLLILARADHDPVLLPGATLVRGEVLLPAAVRRRDLRPGEANDHRTSAFLVSPEEVADAVGELADDRGREHPDAIARPVEAPARGGRCVDADGHADEPRPVLGRQDVHVAQTAGEHAGVAQGIELLPLRAALQTLDQTLVLHPPEPRVEVEVVRAI